jgi:hypothetical protein
MPTSTCPDSALRSQSDSGVGQSLSSRDVAVATLLAACIVALFWKVCFTHAMFFYRDVFNYTYPSARLMHELCRQGHLPYWNPYVNYGQELLANPNFLFFYPSTLAVVLLPVDFAYTMHYVLHFILGAIGVYWLGRRWSQSRAGALTGALFFVLSGPVLSLGSFYNHVACAAWIPWALLLTDVALRSRSSRPWLLLSCVYALQFFGGEPFTLLATVSLCGAYGVHWLLQSPPPRRSACARVVLGFVVAGCLALGLSAVLLLPSSQLLRNSVRGAHGMSFSEASFWSFHPLSLLEILLPNFYGSSLQNPTAWTEAVGTPNTPYFPSVFLGFVPLFLGLVGWAWGRDRRRNFVAGACILFLLLSMGRFTPLFTLAYWLAPPLRLVRFPVKLLVFFVLLVALLAGWGVDALRAYEQITTQRRLRVLLPCGCILATAIAVSMAAWLAPGLISAAAARAFVQAKSLFPDPSHPLTSQDVAAASGYFLEMVRLHVPGLAGFSLAAIAWLVAMGRGKGWAGLALPVVVGVGVLELVLTNYSVNPTVSKFFYAYRPPVLDQVEHGSGPYRFAYIQRDPFYPSEASSVGNFINLDSIPQAAGLSMLAQSGLSSRLTLSHGSMLAKVDAVQNIDLDKSLPTSFVEFWVFLLRQSQDLAHHDCLLGRSNVKYLIRAHLPSAAVNEVGTVFNGSPQPSVLYETRCYAPRTYLARNALHSSSPFETLSRLSDPGFDPEEYVYINPEHSGQPEVARASRPLLLGRLAPARQGDQFPSRPTGKTTAGPRNNRSTALAPLGERVTAEGGRVRGLPVDFRSQAATPTVGRVWIVDYQAGEVTLGAELASPGYVVLLDRYDPNWHAMIDNQEIPILRANHIFRAVKADTGNHVIRFYYQQRGLRAGAALSACSILLLAVLWKLDPGRRLSH